MILSTKCKISVHILPGRHYTIQEKEITRKGKGIWSFEKFEFEKGFVNLSKFEVEKGFLVCFGGFSSHR